MSRRQIIDRKEIVSWCSYTPDGKIWCETRSLHEALEQFKAYDGPGELRFEKHTFEVVTYSPRIETIRMPK